MPRSESSISLYTRPPLKKLLERGIAADISERSSSILFQGRQLMYPGWQQIKQRPLRLPLTDSDDQFRNSRIGLSRHGTGPMHRKWPNSMALDIEYIVMHVPALLQHTPVFGDDMHTLHRNQRIGNQNGARWSAHGYGCSGQARPWGLFLSCDDLVLLPQIGRPS
jgi:hypothetical protein